MLLSYRLVQQGPSFPEPAFVRSDGPLRLKGPVYRIELTNPR